MSIFLLWVEKTGVARRLLFFSCFVLLHIFPYCDIESLNCGLI